MIRFIAAIDEKQGLANDEGIPWRTLVPNELKYFRDKTKHGNVLMGYNTYKEFKRPLSDRTNYVATKEHVDLMDGFQRVPDAVSFIQDFKDDLWNIGGAGLFTTTLELADELYITQLESDFNCTKFFPPFKDNFHLVSESKPRTENGVTYRFQVWAKN